MSEKQANTGVLYVVATPIGNLADMVPRAVETLQQVDCIACEDTRRAAKLLDHFHISAKLLSYHEHNEDSTWPALLSRLQAGESLALISDAGTPTISDPGYALVREAQRAGVTVSPIPGASAAMAALSVSGLPSDRFCFEGFLPAKAAARNKRLQVLAKESRTLIFYEAPHRIIECLQDMINNFSGEREAVLARELTKMYETVRADTLTALLNFVTSDSQQQKGEIVIVVRGAVRVKTESVDEEGRRVADLLRPHMPPKQAAALAQEITGINKKQLYQYIISLNS